MTSRRLDGEEGALKVRLSRTASVDLIGDLL